MRADNGLCSAVPLGKLELIRRIQKSNKETDELDPILIEYNKRFGEMGAITEDLSPNYVSSFALICVFFSFEAAR